MIDSYGDYNPCTFCAEEDGNGRIENECLEFSLCGNKTTLIVREVSVENLTKSKEDGSIVDELTEISEVTVSNKNTPVFSPGLTSSAKKPSLTKVNHRIDTLYTKKWSGNTYFEEEIRKLRDMQYEKDVKDALKQRKLWHSFQIQMMKDRRRELVKSGGPEWWQEPSPKQIMLATTLKDVIKADYEEEVTGRTRQWLLDLGVMKRLTPKQVRRCIKRSLLEPIDFLLEAHAQLVKSQLCVKKKDLQRPFSIDERLLLTAVCVLQLPTLLMMLHYLLPPPEPFPVDNHALELLYGDLNDETIRYSTPYMEPVPFRNRIDFEDWAFGKICSALLPILIQNTESSTGVKKSNLSEKIASNLKQSLSIGSQQLTQNNRISVYSGAPSVALLLSYCLSKRKVSGSMKVNVDDESIIQRKTFGRRLTFIGRNQSHFKVTDSSKVEQTEIAVSSSLVTDSVTGVRENNGALKKETTTLTIQSTPEEQVWPYQSQQNWSYQPSPTWPNQPQSAWQAEYNQQLQTNNYVGPYPSSDPAYYANNQYEDHTNYYENSEGVKPQEKQPKLKPIENEISKASSKPSLEESEDNEETIKNSDKENEAGESLNQLKHIWEEIASYPVKEQLQKAIKILIEMGDPLAQLPKIDKLPTVQRWLELRGGKNRILSKATKTKLLLESRVMWRCAKFGKSNRGPKVDMPKSVERKLTWDKKKWLESEVCKEKQSYFSRVRQEKVDNARSYFPTMLNHYDHGSKLNRNFRDVYFTYLPAREVDTIAYRPWKPNETNTKTKT